VIRNRSLEAAQRDLESEVEEEAAALIKTCGMPLWDALEQAQETVRRRRLKRTLSGDAP
jgi:hypothetical protein